MLSLTPVKLGMWSLQIKALLALNVTLKLFTNDLSYTSSSLFLISSYAHLNLFGIFYSLLSFSCIIFFLCSPGFISNTCVNELVEVQAYLVVNVTVRKFIVGVGHHRVCGFILSGILVQGEKCVINIVSVRGWKNANKEALRESLRMKTL